MNSKDEMKLAYRYGYFASRIITEGIIHPDLQVENIGFGKSGMVLIDFADAEKIRIPDELSVQTIDRLSASLFPLFDHFTDYRQKSYVRAGFSARGGVLADIIMSNCRNNGFTSFTFLEKEQPMSVFHPEESLNNRTTMDLIQEWCECPVEEVTEKNLTNLFAYGDAPERNAISSSNRYYLDRLFYASSFLEIPDDQLPALLANAGCSAFQQNKKYRAYGLLKKVLPLLSGQWLPLKKICTNCFNRVVHMKKLTPEYKGIIDEYIDRDYFELTWLLDDLDSISK